jgi:hypothetical protein
MLHEGLRSVRLSLVCLLSIFASGPYRLFPSLQPNPTQPVSTLPSLTSAFLHFTQRKLGAAKHA